MEQGEAVLLDEYEAVAAPAAGQTAVAAEAPVPAAPKAAPAAGAAPGAGANGTSVNAPMPGNILEVSVKTGDAVKEGQILCILEAMKMENEILAPHAGTVNVLTSKGMVVDTGDLLFAIE